MKDVRTGIRLLSISALAALSLCGPAGRVSAGEMVRFVRAVNGNTVVVDRSGTEETLALIGVVTPDPKDKKKEVSSFGGWARDFLGEFLKDQFVMIESDPKVKKPNAAGNRLAYLYRSRDAAFVNLKMISEGYGIALARIEFSKLKQFEEAENQAKVNAVGLWGDRAGEAAHWGSGEANQAKRIGHTGPGGRGGWVRGWYYSSR